jgi:Neurotransmitter-gated ion-channel ligand binding domain
MSRAVVITILCLMLMNGCRGFDKAKKLYDDLLHRSGYNKFVRPVVNATEKINVKLGLILSQLIDVVSLPALCSVA